MRKMILYILLLITYVEANGQGNAELRQLLGGKNTLDEIMQTVDNYYKTRNTPQFIREWKHWKRWQWEMSRYVNPDGKLVNTRAINYQGVKEAERKEQSRENIVMASSGSWAPIGPSSFNYVADVYRGLGRVNRIAFHPSNASIIYAGTPNGGLWRSTNGGSSWAVLDNYGPELGVSGIVISHADPNDLYVLTGDGDGGGFITTYGYRSYSIGVMKSTDGGSSWSLLTNGLPVSGFRGFSIAQAPSDPDILLLATDDGIYRTTDGGNSWAQMYSNFVSDVKFKPGSPNICYAAGDGWCRRSIDNGATWVEPTFIESPSGANRTQIAVTPAADNYVYLLCGPVLGVGVFKGVWRSTNSGSSFTKFATTPNILGNVTNGQDDTNQTGYDLGLAVSSTDPQDVFTAGTTVWKSTNGGNTFSYATTYVENPLLMPRYIHPDVHDLQVNPLNGYLWAATDGGVYRSTDNSATWTDLSADINTAQPYHLAGVENNSAILYIGTQDNGLKNRYAFTSQWDHFFGRDGFDVVVDYDDNARSYASINQTVRRFNNNGTTTASIPPDSNSWFATLAIDVTDAQTVYCGYGDDVFKSTDRGENWTNTGASGNWCITTCPSNASRIYTAGGASYSSTTGSLYRSDNAAGSWSQISQGGGFPFPYPKITSIGVNPTNSLRVWVTFGGTTANTKVYYSNDGGDTWSNIQSSSLPNVPINCIAITSNNDAYAGTDIGVYYRPSGGTWTPFYNGLPKSPVSDIELNETAGVIRVSLFGRGVWSSSVFSDCVANLLVSGTETGFKLYEASSSVASSGTTTVTGGYGTEVLFKGGQEVHLVDGFRAVQGSAFRGYINDCGEGGIPLTRENATSQPITHLKLPSNKDRLHPYGTITLNKTGSEVIWRIHQPGSYSLQVVDEKGNIIQKIPGSYLQKGEYHTSLQLTAISKEFLYLQMLLNGEIVHYQEIGYLNK